jgi:hypothetical protein
MAPRIHIPAIALLGLQLTECSGSPEDPLVGDWVAVEVDGMQFPLTYSEYGNDERAGVTLHVEPDMLGDLTRYYAGVYEDIGFRGEYVSPLVADNDEAPRYLLTITIPVQQTVSGGEDYADSGFDEGYADEGYADGGEPPAGPDQQDTVTTRPHPRAATATLQLDCTLGAEFLVCKTTSDTEDQPTDWRFARVPEDT